MADTVTISKEYFDTLLRRTQVRVEGAITLPQHEFDFLLKCTQEYTALRAALMKGGVDATTVDVLVHGACEDVASPEKDGTAVISRPSCIHEPGQHRQYLSFQSLASKCSPQSLLVCSLSLITTTVGSFRVPDSTSPEEFEELNYDGTSTMKTMSGNQQCEYGQDHEQDEGGLHGINRDDRSVVLKGISPFTPMADVLAVIRGGAVLNIFLRPQQRTAHVAFVEPNAAEKFLIHSKRTDTYIKGKRECAALAQTELLLTANTDRSVLGRSSTFPAWLPCSPNLQQRRHAQLGGTIRQGGRDGRQYSRRP